MGLVPITLPYPTVLFDRLDQFLLEFEEQDKLVEAGVVSEGEGAAYALVWEWGNARQKQLGPKTTLGINPDGSSVFLSIQAPRGYIRVNTPLFQQAMDEETAKIEFSSETTGKIFDELNAAALRAAKRIAEIIKEHVPVDTGQLHDSIKVAKYGDPILDSDEDDNALVLGADSEGE